MEAALQANIDRPTPVTGEGLGVRGDTCARLSG